MSGLIPAPGGLAAHLSQQPSTLPPSLQQLLHTPCPCAAPGAAAGRVGPGQPLPTRPPGAGAGTHQLPQVRVPARFCSHSRNHSFLCQQPLHAARSEADSFIWALHFTSQAVRPTYRLPTEQSICPSAPSLSQPSFTITISHPFLSSSSLTHISRQERDGRRARQQRRALAALQVGEGRPVQPGRQGMPARPGRHAAQGLAESVPALLRLLSHPDAALLAHPRALPTPAPLQRGRAA